MPDFSMLRPPRGLLAAGLPLVIGCATGSTPRPQPAPVSPAPAAAPAAAPTPAPAPTPAAAAPAHDMAAMGGMAGMDHSQHMMGGAGHTMGGDMPPVTIPKGAIYTEADVRFMQGMIAHHAQAIHMSRMAATRGANPRLLKLAQKIDQSQAGEIVLMQQWLRANGQVAPDTSSWRTMTMAGMLTTAELAALEAARGESFDKLFLTGMIRHHQGALSMVADLYKTPRAAQDVDVSVFANDVETVQTAEIAMMRQMLLEY